ncbi:MAG TPA: Mov34/MPN/PAD-1 family protein [Thermoanaerobaculia bacterium]|nr:Mov34/MPN/PAD-1 family protein [Thermoanaerobaculia bacterium]
MYTEILLQLALTVRLIVPLCEPGLPDDEIARLSYELLHGTGAVDQIEHAAFIVRTAEETLELMHWPGRGYYSASWRGPVPPGVVAVIHTHPRHRPAPSGQDRAEATRLGLPFYVVSRAALCVADASESVRCATRIPWLMRGQTADVALQWQHRIPPKRVS